jgi:thymidylate synthase (FAD)
MGKFVTPKVYLIGYTGIDLNGLESYLRDTGNEYFLELLNTAKESGLSDGEILVSFYAKLCYASLSLGHNDNISKIRDIPDNLRATQESGHTSVWEHVMLNFVIKDCSRIMSHELVRHRTGTAYSQESGRYVRTNEVDIVFDPILEPVRDMIEKFQWTVENYYKHAVRAMKLDEMRDFSLKKKVTSALRRILPNGQSNEMGFSVNLTGLRHQVQVRTSRHAEWEIRLVYNQIYQIVKSKYPILFSDATETEVDGLLEVSGMKTKPY